MNWSNGKFPDESNIKEIHSRWLISIKGKKNPIHPHHEFNTIQVSRSSSLPVSPEFLPSLALCIIAQSQSRLPRVSVICTALSIPQLVHMQR